MLPWGKLNSKGLADRQLAALIFSQKARAYQSPGVPKQAIGRQRRVAGAISLGGFLGEGSVSLQGRRPNCCGSLMANGGESVATGIDSLQYL